MKNIQFIVLTCDKYIDNRVKTIKETWGKNENVIFLTDSKSNEKDVIGYDTNKDYSGIFQKYHLFFKTYDFNFFDYYFFTDDDTFVIKKNLEKLSIPPKDEKFCIGRLLCLNSNGTDLWGNQTGTDLSEIYGENTTLPLYYMSGGSGFILSKAACISIQEYLNSTNDVPHAKFGDMSIGFWMRNSNIELIPNSNFWWDIHDKLLNNTWEKYSSDVDVITFHYVNENLMLEYQKKYN